MTELHPKTNVEDIAERIREYIRVSGFTIDSLLGDSATILLPNGELDTVQSDLDNVMGMRGDRISTREQLDVAFALGLVLGRACEYSQTSVHHSYEKIAYNLVRDPVRQQQGEVS